MQFQNSTADANISNAWFWVDDWKILEWHDRDRVDQLLSKVINGV